MWTLAGLVALDVVIAGVFAACAAGYRYRGLRQLRHLEAMWHAEPQHASSYPWAGRRVRRRRVIAPVVLGTVILAGTAMASQGALDVVGSALGNIATHLGIGPDRQTVVAAPVSEDAAAPLREHRQVGDPEASNPGADQRAHAQSQPAPADPSIDDPTTTDQAGVAPTGGPSMLTATPTSASTIELAWSNTAGESAYRVERSTNGGGAGWAPVTTIGQNVTGFTDSPLSAATTYFYRVIAIRDGVDSVPSAVASATTIVDPPATPALLTAQALSSSEIALSWGDVATETGYRIERSDDGGTGWTTIGTAGQDVTSFTDAGLNPGTGYAYRVIAINAGGESVPSTPAFTTTTTADAGTPVEPSAS